MDTYTKTLLDSLEKGIIEVDKSKTHKNTFHCYVMGGFSREFTIMRNDFQKQSIEDYIFSYDFPKPVGRENRVLIANKAKEVAERKLKQDREKLCKFLEQKLWEFEGE